MKLSVTSAEWLMHDVLAQVLEPPPPVDYLAWAEENIVFEGGPFPGPYNSQRFSYFNAVLRALSPSDPCRIVTLSKSAQLGGTEIANIFTCGTLAMDPQLFLYSHPTEGNAVKWSKTKLSPILKSTSSMRDIFASKSRDGGDSILFKERRDGRGAIQISGANSSATLSMISPGRQVQDDLAKWKVNDAGDPETQADSRSRAFEFAKILKISTPLIVPGCRITKNFEAGSQEYLYVPCPDDTCGVMQTLEWENMLNTLDEDHPEKACFHCVECGGIIEEYHRPKMLAGAEWRAEQPEQKRYHRSFHIWSAYSPLQTFEQIARDWLSAKGDPASEQTFMNDVVGRAYKVLGEAPSWEELRDRASESHYRNGTIPAGFPYLTCGVDCQGDRVEWQVIAWGPNKRRAVVDYGVFDGHISEEKCQASLNALLRQGFPNAYGRKIEIDVLAIDGNAYTEDVWDWIRKHPASKVLMVRGRPEEHLALIAKVKKERNKQGKLLKYSKRFYNFASSVLKMSLYRNVRKEDPETSGHVLFPMGLDDEFYRQLTAESRQPQKSKTGFTTYKWVKDPNQANEGLDTHLQAEVAFIRVAGTQRNFPDAIWDDLMARRECAPEEVQGDFEDLLMSPPKPAEPNQTTQTGPDRKKSSGPSKWKRRTQ